MEEIVVKIKDDGKVEIECNGFQGAECDITKAAEEALGMVDRSDKDEFFKQELNMEQFNTN